MIKKICKKCNKEFLTYPSQNYKHCSKSCAKKGFHPVCQFRKGQPPWNKGLNLTKKHRENMSKSHIGQIPWNKGTKGIMKAWNKGLKGYMAGEKHYNWKGGIASENNKIRQSIESRLWRESVFARDNWTCQKCEKRGGNISPHHILNFAQYINLRFAIDNGITFCKECHINFHIKYGKKNNNEKQLLEFLD